MLILNGVNLGERHKQLNIKVKEASINKVDFDQIKDEPEHSDVDKLFKIDLASKYMNIEYIVEVLKSGDSLHIARALKCTWMFDDQFANIINVDNLHLNVFPLMSLKMRKKFLTTMALYIRKPDRALAFYNYCIESKLPNIALKFLIFTTDEFKLKIVMQYPEKFYNLPKNEYKHLIGSSFTLADALLSSVSDSSKVKVLTDICYLYSVSNEKYLDMMEKHLTFQSFMFQSDYFGLRVSKDIITKHKHRVLKLPSIYIRILNKTLVAKHSNVNDAKTYMVDLLPNEVHEFWNQSFFIKYDYILNILPDEEKIVFMKKIYNDKYPRQEFEMSHDFYDQKLYKFMTEKQREQWALAHIASQKEILGLGNDYKWYKFINFDKSFEEIKKLVMITNDNTKRPLLIYTLVSSAKTQRDLEKLFKYYYERHINEQRYNTENFITFVTNNHNVYDFDKDCWEAFNKILQHLDVYSTLIDTGNGEFKIIALIYSIINKIEVHEALKLYISTNMYFYSLKLKTDKLTKEQQDVVYEYLFNFYMEIINECDAVPYDDEIKYKVRKFLYFILDLMSQYERTEAEIPQVVMKLLKLDWDEFACHKLIYKQPKNTTQDDLIRILKKDAKLATQIIPEVKKNIEDSYRFNIGQFLKKLKVYFSYDISKDYLKFYNTLLTETQLYPKVAQAAAYGIFQLADNNFKVDFMKMYAPTDPKINRGEIEERLLFIQQAICATAFYSRPPVPLENMLMYLKGDYVHSCLPLFNSYLAHLPLPLCIKFIEEILNTPLSIQKHGVRLAFVCFDSENLRKLVMYIWKRPKNVSLRQIIYTALYKKICAENQNAPTALMETLTKLTLELYEDDDNDVFALITSGGLPAHYLSDYISAAWKAVSALPKNTLNWQRMTAVLKFMNDNILKLRQDIIRPIVKEFVQSVFEPEEGNDINDDNSLPLIHTKWNLTVSHITYVQNKDDLDTKLELMKYILNQCLSKFNLVDSNRYVMQQIYFNFLHNLISRKYLNYLEGIEYVNTIIETALQMIETSFAIEAVYLVIWEFRIYLAARKMIIKTKNRLPSLESDEQKNEVLREVTFKFGKEIGDIIKQFIEKDIYFMSFQQELEGKFLKEMNSMVYNIDYDIHVQDLLVVTCAALAEFEMTEMYLFALNIVPYEYSRQYVTDYESFLNKIKELNNLEIRCKMYNKFVNTDFMPRAFLQL